jgi:hypothetical protein
MSAVAHPGLWRDAERNVRASAVRGGYARRYGLLSVEAQVSVVCAEYERLADDRGLRPYTTEEI